jgi:hypothetical protein
MQFKIKKMTCLEAGAGSSGIFCIALAREPQMLPKEE